MLRPLDTPTRERRSLNGLWSFRLDPAGLCRRESWWTAPLAEARQVTLIASRLSSSSTETPTLTEAAPNPSKER